MSYLRAKAAVGFEEGRPEQKEAKRLKVVKVCASTQTLAEAGTRGEGTERFLERRGWYFAWKRTEEDLSASQESHENERG